VACGDNERPSPEATCLEREFAQEGDEGQTLDEVLLHPLTSEHNRHDSRHDRIGEDWHITQGLLVAPPLVQVYEQD
jgi:hypothetical protein